MRYILLLLLLAGCGEIEEIWEDFQDANEAIIDVVDPTDSPNPPTTSTTTTTIVPPTNPTCGGTHYPPNNDGFLWKPESESNGELVILLPYNHQKQHNVCRVYDGVVADSCTWAGYHNGGRQHWRCPRPGHQYNAPALVLCNDGTQDCAWYIPTPWSRIE